MNQAQKKSGWGGALLGLLIVLALIGLVSASANLRALLIAAMAQVTVLSVLATFPAQALAMLLCAAALWALRPGVGFWACFGSRVLRDASGNLPVSLPGFSALIGARALVLTGGETHAAISATTLDKLAEIVAQFPFIGFAVWVLWNNWPLSFALPQHSGLIAMAGAVLLVLGAAVWWKFGAGSALARRLLDEWRKLLAEARQQKAGMPLSLLLHSVAWFGGGVQIWMAAQALGYDLTLYEAVAVESAAYAGRAMFFFIPAGLISQEAALVAAGLLFGLTAPQALALGLIMRLRDALMALALVAWPLVEWRRRKI